jgi:hypothetical protein
MGLREGLLGARDPLSQRLLGHKESAGDLCRGEAADQTQRKGDASFHCKDRMACGKDKPQYVITDNLVQCLLQSICELLLLIFKFPGNVFVLLYKHASAAQRIESAWISRPVASSAWDGSKSSGM